VDFFCPFKGWVCIENLLEGSLGPDVSIVMKIDEAETVKEARVFPVFTVKRVELLISG
jgi:hypothetical protein